VCIARAVGALDLHDSGFAVIALGKLGGSELNYASDVDLLFVHGGTGPREQALADNAAATFIKLLSDPTGEGIALRVDAALRPGGRGALLSRSLDATLRYYGEQSATWERQAMIKARACAGDPRLGDAFVAGVEPFVYPGELAPRAIDEVRRTKVRLEEYMRRRGKEFIEVKRGHGGIRDVEFAVQLLQIVHGRRDPLLRSPNTLIALNALAEEGYVARADADALADAYRFLRRLEHRLQIVRDLQTHDLPADPAARTTIARSLGMPAADALAREYERTTTLVRGIHERLFYRPLLEAFAGPAAPASGSERVATEELLAGLGFAEPARSYELLQRLVDPGTRMGKVLAHVFPLMAPALALSADPDAALVRLERVCEAVGERHGPADALATDPGSARRLAHVVAVSGFATDLLVADPERLRALADGVIHADDAGADLARVVGRWGARELLPRETGAAIAQVGDRVIQEAVDDAAPTLPLAVIGLGKLGARELNFASDLDLVFVYDGEGPKDQKRAVTAAEQIMAGVKARGWEPDADLRPEGRNGPLARSIAGYLEYWERYAETWEFQTLLRARHVAGDADLGRRFVSNAGDFAYPPDGLTIDRVSQIRHMRERIERERVKPPEAGKFHFKLGYGSLSDVQFAVEVSLMRHGGAHPDVRTPRTLEAIDRLAERKLLEGGVARDLGSAFVFLSDVKNALEVDRRLHAEAVPAQPLDQDVLARRLGYEEYPRQSFIDDYLRITRRCRRAMDRVFADQIDMEEQR
ncbi:MAG: [glutamine synthetase] adenylyltransferase / [glutamine synthetase]-adenylyl-L-tyrosine, partial [Actinomycetota bacterium]|nr:[glutamine synthetase] adenylyltransferase / [glutamine synthetase]-adenylyl-L-tyrosine [Actinomycetota bacterium]